MKLAMPQRQLVRGNAFLDRCNVIVRLWKNRRPDQYEAFVSRAIEQGYSFIRMQDVKESTSRAHTKSVVLRHDIDHDTKATRTLASIERRHGVVGTYYFRWKTANRQLIRDLITDGHECSLHYETFSDYYLLRRLNPRKHPVTDTILTECVARLGDEIQRFEKLIADCGSNQGVRTIAAHGERINRKLGIPNNRVFEFSPASFPGITEAYDRAYLSQLDMHISDSPLWICGGFRYGLHPLDAIDKGLGRLQLLVHPNHWDLRLVDQVYESLRTCLHGVTTKPHVFRQ